jgi:PEGA domain
VQQRQANMGGLSFEITPSTAQLFVDGALVGTVGQFTSTTQPLGLVAGRHQIEIRAPGYQTMSLDVDVIAGQVIPYQGALER